MSIHIDYAPIKGCKNTGIFGEICVKCNKCHRFNPNFKCLNCGKRTTAMKAFWAWKFVELYDVFKVPVCPDCQKYFTDGEMAIGREWWKRDVIGCQRKDFIKRR